VTIKTDHAGYYQWVLELLGLSELGRNEEVLRRFEVLARSSDFWNDPAAGAHVAGRPFAREATLFESRFVKKRKPIYFIDLGKR
jgi:hypothetical protein